MVIETALLATALFKVAEKLAEKGIVDPALEKGLEPFKKWLTSGYDARKADKDLQEAFSKAIRKMKAPEEKDELARWLKNTGLDRLQAQKNDVLRQQVATAILTFTSKNAPPPESLMTALGWPRSRAAELSQLLADLRAGLAGTSWQPLLDYAGEVEKLDLLKSILQGISQLDRALVQTPEGEAIRVVWVKNGLSEREAAEIEQRYRRNLLAEFENLETRGLSPQLLTSKPGENPALKTLPLEAVYLEPGLIPLRPEREREAEWEEMLQADESQRLMTELRQQQKRVTDALTGSPKLVIVGKPGSGKTVSLKFIALMLARGQVGAIRLRLEAPYLPVYVRLAQYAELLKDHPTLSLETFLMENTGRAYMPGAERFGEFMQITLEKGLCMLLLDGLDEVGDVGDTLVKGKTLRAAVLEEVQRFARQRCQAGCENHILVTSRLEGYNHGDLRDFEETEMSALALPAEVREFLLRWFAAHEQKNNPALGVEEVFRRAEASVDPLMNDIDRSPGVQRLAINPLLLTILAMIHKLGTRLPNERVRLYQIVAQTMIESWRQAHTLHGISIYEVLPVSRITPLMAALAYWVHDNKPGGTMPADQWKTEIVRLLQAKDDELKLEKAEALAEQFMRHAREEVGLLIERSPGQIGFLHLTLEEYLAGVEIATRRESERREMVRQRWENPRWREVLLLAAGQLMIIGSQELDDFVLDLRMRDDQGRPELLGLPALLAGKAITDAGAQHFGRKLVRETRAELTQLGMSSKLPAPTRAECADLADELEYQPEDLYTFVPFRGRRNIPAFAIARYPVTNAQYARFLEAQDFHAEKYWTAFPKFAGPEKDHAQIGDWGEAGYIWLKAIWDAHNKVEPPYWKDPRFGLRRPNAPVVGITWYEANAYCQWLLENWGGLEEGRQGLPKPRRVRLPTEAQWMLAAGGGEKGRFAFGELNEPQKEIPACANTSESGIHRTTPVWMYPKGASPAGVMDMSGNVWEWQANYLDKDEDVLPLRGGSWDFNREHARVSVRRDFFLRSGNLNFGFRVCVLPG